MRERAMPAAVAAAAIVVAAILGPRCLGTSPIATDLPARLATPSLAHWLGQDALGRDVLARVLAGAQLSLWVAAATVLCSGTIGVAVGAGAGLAGGWPDELAGRLIDVLQAFPGLLLAIAFAAMLGPSPANVVIALSLLGWTGYARLTRAEVGRLRTREFVQAATALGASPVRVAVRHLLPLAAPALLVQATFGLSGAIVAEASLSFLGLGAPPPTPSWGAMLDEARPFLLVAPHLTLAPGVALAATVLVVQSLGDRLRDRLDVRGE